MREASNFPRLFTAFLKILLIVSKIIVSKMKGYIDLAIAVILVELETTIEIIKSLRSPVRHITKNANAIPV
jgi:hypothetical protein